MTDGVNKYQRVYGLLKAYGFTPRIALEIVLDAKRTNTPSRAMFMIRLARTSLRPARRKTIC